MCGRFTRTSSRHVIAQEFGVASFVNVDLSIQRYNIAPSQFIEAIIQSGTEKRLGPMRWGFIAGSVVDSKIAPINARAETVASTQLFRDAFRRRHCLIVADGFYEWKKEERGTKTPYHIHLRSGRPFAFAGLWSFYHEAVSTRLASCAILTCPPNELMAQIHNRMPVILPAAARDRWLNPTAAERDLGQFLVPFPADEMEAYPVSTLVNKPTNDAPECVQRISG